MTLLQACLNGIRAPGEHPALPVTAAELAADARRAVAAGARELHVHARGADGTDSVEAGAVAQAVAAIRAACPGVPLGLTTGLWTTDGDVELRLERVAAWDELPDYASVNIGEPGCFELCELLGRRGIGVEAGVWTLTDAGALGESGIEPLRVLVETSDGENDDPIAAAAEIDQLLTDAGVSAAQLHHGADEDAWPMLEAALTRGRDVRIGLEDTLWMPDGSIASDNAQLVEEAARRLGGRSWDARR